MTGAPFSWAGASARSGAWVPMNERLRAYGLQLQLEERGLKLRGWGLVCAYRHQGVLLHNPNEKFQNVLVRTGSCCAKELNWSQKGSIKVLLKAGSPFSGAHWDGPKSYTSLDPGHQMVWLEGLGAPQLCPKEKCPTCVNELESGYCRSYYREYHDFCLWQPRLGSLAATR